MFVVNTAFETVAEAKLAITTTLLDAELSYRAHKSDKTRLILKCRDRTCTFHLRASYSKRHGKALITAYHPHVCGAETHFDFKERRRVKYLKGLHTPAILNDRAKATPASIIFNERNRRGNSIEYMSAYRVRQAVLLEADGVQSSAFALLPDLLARIGRLSIKQVNDHMVKFKKHARTNQFEAIAVTPSPTRTRFSMLRPFIALDGTFTSGRYPMTLLAATAMDGNNQLVLLSFALVPTESTLWWEWFLLHLSDSYDCGGEGINSEENRIVFVSDRDKGLEASLSAVFPAADHGMCAFHLSKNVKSKFGAKAAAFILPLARAKTENAFQLILDELTTVSAGAATYLEATDRRRWARYVFLYPRFGHTTSNLAEVLNNALKDIRQLPPLQLIEGIWRWIMQKRYDRNNRDQPGFLANKPMAIYERLLELGSQFQVYRSRRGLTK